MDDDILTAKPRKSVEAKWQGQENEEEDKKRSLYDSPWNCGVFELMLRHCFL
jgi:hypothetical protein